MKQNTQLIATQELIKQSLYFRERGDKERKLRDVFLSHLRTIFNDDRDTNWVNHFAVGGEHHIKILDSKGNEKDRFIDNLVNSTEIEFEKDLRTKHSWDDGHRQVCEYASGIIRQGISPSQVRGIVSDTVDWYVYDIEINEGANLDQIKPDEIRLIKIDELKLIDSSAKTAQRYLEFIRKHLARQESRALNAENITLDLGLKSKHYTKHVKKLMHLIDEAMSESNSVELATSLWAKFVDNLELEGSDFRLEAFATETYMSILARLLCANVLQQKGLLSEDKEMLDIISGTFFEANFLITNMVEQDYFGWISKEPYFKEILDIAREIQIDLYAYDYQDLPSGDLFGHLMAQLAGKTQRKLLGQEWTPPWLARQLAKKCLENIGHEKPFFLDMCCGSGAIIAEVLKEIMIELPTLSDEELFQSMTGFDIDPLAVMLSKITWIITLADKIRACKTAVTIPIFHADTLYAVTPISHHIPLSGEMNNIEIEIEGRKIALPMEFIAPESQQIFDTIINWVHDEIIEAEKQKNADFITLDKTTSTITGILEQHDKVYQPKILKEIISGVFELTKHLGALASKDRNGIWAFILKNTYRPGLLAGKFNGLVSNPPWLTMSNLADNPYKFNLTKRAKLYGIKPTGSAHPHLELATTYLMHAVDYYLSTNAVIGCLVPGTILNGDHHQPLRDGSYLTAKRPVPLEIEELWNIEKGTFKVRSVAIIGKKLSKVKLSVKAPKGFISSPSGLIPANIHKRELGNKTAWSFDENDINMNFGENDVLSKQGADLMPRTTVCIEILNDSRNEYQVTTPNNDSPWYFSIKDGKVMKEAHFKGGVHPNFIHRMAQSLNLLPFVMDGKFVSIAIPARKRNGEWETLPPSGIRNEGLLETAKYFSRINDEIEGDALEERINLRNKLTAQTFDDDGYLILTGAGGSKTCAAFLPVKRVGKVVIDQTLYWQIVPTITEAFYLIGMLNSKAVTKAIKSFVPEGEFGGRHLHTLPYRVIPKFNESEKNHHAVAVMAKKVFENALHIVSEDDYIGNPANSIAQRRKKLLTELEKISDYAKLEKICEKVLGLSK
ncbi:hypothetical protein KJ662_03310 [Patescibacteria group bacterium]|nr:hypothetical protein [Patescibacteria group bacterium]